MATKWARADLARARVSRSIFGGAGASKAPCPVLSCRSAVWKSFLSSRSSASAKKSHVLVVNAGSSSLKCKVFEMNKDDHKLQIYAVVNAQKVGEDGSYVESKNSGGFTKQRVPMRKHSEAISEILTLLGLKASELYAVGHRVVHGGEYFKTATFVDLDVKERIRKLSNLAPLHNPVNLSGIEAVEAIAADVPQVAVFDTAFHQTIPRENYLYALPLEVYEKYGVRSYGAHGTSYAYIVDEIARLLKRPSEQLNLIVCHLGAGASMTCVKAGRSFNTTMGMTPLDGLIMATRCGKIDPGAVLFLAGELGVRETDRMLNRSSGLLGLTGERDMQLVLEKAKKGDKDAKCALDAYVARVRSYIGSYLVQLCERVDALVFSAGVGEHAVEIRRRVCEGLEVFGLSLDLAKNDANETEVQSAQSKAKIMVVPTDEELRIAQETVQVINSM